MFDIFTAGSLNTTKNILKKLRKTSDRKSRGNWLPESSLKIFYFNLIYQLVAYLGKSLYFFPLSQTPSSKTSPKSINPQLTTIT